MLLVFIHRLGNTRGVRVRLTLEERRFVGSCMEGGWFVTCFEADLHASLQEAV